MGQIIKLIIKCVGTECLHKIILYYFSLVLSFPLFTFLHCTMLCQSTPIYFLLFHISVIGHIIAQYYCIIKPFSQLVLDTIQYTNMSVQRKDFVFLRFHFLWALVASKASSPVASSHNRYQLYDCDNKKKGLHFPLFYSFVVCTMQ